MKCLVASQPSLQAIEIKKRRPRMSREDQQWRRENSHVL